ncbi:hypothetical protein HK405_007764 [Cladochytrium tenue]|nr:hypothetical protein HK405_007764 [Cladochytrium tenue]
MKGNSADDNTAPATAGSGLESGCRSAEDEPAREGAADHSGKARMGGTETYFLPSDDDERRRLEEQHIIFRHLFSGLFHTPQRALLEARGGVGGSGGEATVLDVGCGPGSWTLEMAAAFPNASFVGVDKASYDHKDLPKNVVFKNENLVDGLSFTSQMKAKGVDCRVGGRLAQLCASAGLHDIKERVEMFPIGWNGPVGDLCAVDLRQVMSGAAAAAAAAAAGLNAAGRDEAAHQAFVDAALRQAAEQKIFMKAFCVTARVDKA